MTHTTTIKFTGPVAKYIIAANNIVIPAIISKYATNFATDTTCSRSKIYKENVSGFTFLPKMRVF